MPAEIVPRAWNQLRISGRWRRRLAATFFIGSSRERMVRRHHSSRNLPAQPGLA